jgi:hypothetical protein
MNFYFVVICPKAQNAINAAKSCITDAGAGEAVTAAAATGPGQKCFQKLMNIRETIESKINFDKINECGDTLIASAGEDVLKKCFDDNRPPRGPKSNNKQ